jgi:pre-rRNA-processing protein TSR1
LPLDYARIFQFENFNRTKQRVLQEDNESTDRVDVGEYVTITLSAVPESITERNGAVPFVIFSLLQHENKMSVVHFQLTMHADYQLPIKYVTLLFLIFHHALILM